MSDLPAAQSVTLRNRKPLAPPFHRHIAKSKMMNTDYEVGDRVIIYDIVATEPSGRVRVEQTTQFIFE
jgi:hypothetical protein